QKERLRELEEQEEDMANIKRKQTIETTYKMLNLMTLGCRIEMKSPQLKQLCKGIVARTCNV
ncbi:MAG TPA: hypothetical protein VGI61_10030, partial [Parafilimonas sp.]